MANRYVRSATSVFKGAAGVVFAGLGGFIGVLLAVLTNGWLPLPYSVAVCAIAAVLLAHQDTVEERDELRTDKELREITGPRFVFDQTRWTPVYAGGSYKFHILQIWLKNRPEVTSKASTAEDVTVTVCFFKPGESSPFINYVSQWVQLPDPDLAVTGMSDPVACLNIPANDNPAKLILLLQHLGLYPEPHCYAHSFGKLIGAPDGKHEPYRIEPGRYRVSLKLRGGNVDQSVEFTLVHGGAEQPPNIAPRDGDALVSPATVGDKPEERPAPALPLAMDISAAFADDTLILSIRNDGPTDTFVVQLRYMLGASPCGPAQFVFPISLRWKGHAGEQRDILNGQIQHIEVLKAGRTLSEDQPRQASIGPLTLLTASSDVGMHPNWFAPGKLADGLHMWLDIASAKTGNRRQVPLHVHLACADLQVQRVVCHLVA